MMHTFQPNNTVRRCINAFFTLRHSRLLTLSLLSIALQACGGDSASSSVPKPAVSANTTLSATSASTNKAAVITPTQPKALLTTGSLSTACSGASCGAVTPTLFSGKGTGLWRYDNTSANDVAVNIDIAGVSAGKQVTLTFTNGNPTAVSSKPNFGTRVAMDIQPSPLNAKADTFLNIAATANHTVEARAKEAMHEQHEASHAILRTKNQAVHQRLLQVKADSTRAIQAESTLSVAPKTQASPALNTTRSWTDIFPATPVKYATTNRYVCTLPTGRNIVFWQETKDTKLTPALLSLFTTNTCGTTGMFARLNTLLGDMWGKNPYTSQLIQDTAQAKQDVNIIFVNAGKTIGWAGYFYGGNNFYSTATSPSNQALAFFINTADLQTDPSYYVSSLTHEATHMIAFYQNDVVRGKSWANTWLDETFAMMSEDIVVPAVMGYNKIAEYRLPSYMATGGNISLNNWLDLSNSNYSMGGSLGSFLNRQYGLSVYQQLITGCTTGAAKTDDYTCLNSLVANNGGVGIGDELAKMGATLFSKAPLSTTLAGYGYPTKTTGAYTLKAIDLQNMTVAAPVALTRYQSMSQTYVKDTIAAGKTRYTRNAVIVPARTHLKVVIN
jgi:hypothetical protein